MLENRMSVFEKVKLMLDMKIKLWLIGCKTEGYKFAMVRTFNAIYDRVAILPAKGHAFIVEYPKKLKGGWSIVSEIIPMREVITKQYYKD